MWDRVRRAAGAVERAGPPAEVAWPWPVRLSGRTPTGMDAVRWAEDAQRRGAGEILLTSIDRDGTREGFDCELTAAVSDAVSIPVIASGGAGTFQHFLDVFTTGHADAALAASVFHYSEHAVSELKQFLADSTVPVRLRY